MYFQSGMQSIFVHVNNVTILSLNGYYTHSACMWG